MSGELLYIAEHYETPDKSLMKELLHVFTKLITGNPESGVSLIKVILEVIQYDVDLRCGGDTELY